MQPQHDQGQGTKEVTPTSLYICTTSHGQVIQLLVWLYQWSGNTALSGQVIQVMQVKQPPVSGHTLYSLRCPPVIRLLQTLRVGLNRQSPHFPHIATLTIWLLCPGLWRIWWGSTAWSWRPPPFWLWTTRRPAWTLPASGRSAWAAR